MMRRIFRGRANVTPLACASSAAVKTTNPVDMIEMRATEHNLPLFCGQKEDGCVLCQRVASNLGMPMSSRLASISSMNLSAARNSYLRHHSHLPIANQLRSFSNTTTVRLDSTAKETPPISNNMNNRNIKPNMSSPSNNNGPLAAKRVVNTLHIGDVSLPIYESCHPERVASGLPPAATAFFNPNRPETLRYIRWLAQKDLLKQDVCIVGDPGPTKRWLAMLFAQYAGKEVQLLCLSRDTTEADIKQRKEIRDGTLYYVNQAAVTAALEGQLLIIDGLERAERNVLPVINNLLENREMHLDNGLMLIAPQRYDQLCAEHGVTDLSDWGLLRVSENFRVIGLTVPIPKFSGNPLDPPLRSRFQCLYLDQTGSSSVSSSGSSSSGAAPTYLTYDVIPKAIRGTQPVEAMLKFRAVQNTVDNAGSDRDRVRSFPAVTDFDIGLWSMQHELFPKENLGEILQRIYPFELFIRSGPKAEQATRRSNIRHLLKKYALLSEDCATKLESVSSVVGNNAATLTFSDGKERVVPCGSRPIPSSHPLFGGSSDVAPSADGDDHSSFFTDAHRRALTGLLQSHTCGRHMALVGSAGCGKTNLIREFASLLGYEVETQHLFRDMSTRDLLQRRATDLLTGSTTWELSPLMIAVKEGRLAVLDGIDQLSPGALAVLQELVLDGNITLFDGTVFKNEKAYEELKTVTLGLSSDKEMNARGIYKVHPSFRLIATARYPTPDASAKKVWLTSDLVPLVDWHVLPDLAAEDVFRLLSNVTKRFATAYSSATGETDNHYESVNLRASGVSAEALIERQSSRTYQEVLASLVELQAHLAEMSRRETKIPTLTLRQLRHISKHVLVFPDDLFGILESSLLLPLTSPLIAGQVKAAMAKCGITDPDGTSSSAGSGSRGRSGSRGNASTSTYSQKKVGNPFEVTVSSATNTKKICKSFGHEVMHITRAYTGKEKALVPHVPSFHANRLQLTLQAWIAKNLASGNNILLVGNQGVGKNKIVDQLLMEVGLPRHYLQLHRDTTVSSLTINPTVVEGKVMWEDSPLVKAVQQGHVLVVDEIDKAPVEVVHILKGLIEDREMRLGDGRKISGWATTDEKGKTSIRDPNVIPIHPDFRVIVLANPPGFPFHGNDFYRECGDLFSCFVVQNPDPSSQQELLQKIAPQVPAILITKLIMVFTELGALFAAGTIQYPFSLRELIAVVRHLQAFPRDGLYQALNNVFSFDLLNENTMNHVRRLLHQYIAPISQAQLRSGLGENLVAKETLLGKLLNFATFTVAPPTSVTDANLKASFGYFEGGNAEVSVESSAVGEGQKDKKKSLKYSVCDAFPPSTADSSKDRSFTEKLGYADISHLLLAGESIVCARQSSSSVDTAAKKTILLTSRNRIIFLPTPAAGGSMDGLSTGSQLLSGEGANTAVVVDLGQSTISSELESAIILGDSAPLADAIFSTSSPTPTAAPSSFSAGEQRAIAHLLSSSESATKGSTLSISTVAVGTSSSGTAGSSNNNTDAVSLTTIKFKNVTAACTRLAGEGCVAVASQSAESSHPVLSFLYYGRSFEVSGGALTAEHFSRITRIDAISSQVFFIVGEGPSKNFVGGFLKLSVFRDRCEPYFHSVSITDLPPPADKKLEDVDERIRLSALSIQNLLATDGSFSGIASGEGYIPTPGPLTADNLQNALFTMKPSTMTNRDGQTVHVIKPKDVLYATAKVETVSENGLLMVTLEGAVNRLDKPIQLAAANGRAVTADSTSTSVAALPIASEQSSWVKVAEYGSSVTAGASSAAAGAIGSNSHSHSAEFGHHQLVARDPNTSAVCVVSTQKGTIREFPTAYSGSGSGANTGSSSIMEKARSLFGSSSSSQGAEAVNSGSLMTSVGPDGIGTTVSSSGAVTTFDTNAERLNEGYSRWNSVLKGGVEELGQPPTPEELNMWYSKPRKQADADNLKHGEEDPDNTPHSGGNNWAGGTGGTDTAGLGGLTGPYRLDKGHPVSQVDPAEKKKVPQHILDEARRMGKEALEKRLKEINMSVSEDERYRDAFERVQGPVQQLRSMLEGLRSKERERAWMRHQTDGVWDDAKLVEGVTGEKTVYKRRIEADENMPFGKPEQKKRLLFVMDVSASMYRFNGMDQRLTKSVECAIMIMEAFKGFEEKIDYSIIGHNGDSGNLPLVPFGQPPTNKKQRMDVCMKMIAYSQYCWSGDNTVTAMEKSLDIVTAEPADGYFVFVISDANFQQYGISPAHLSRIIKAKDEVNMFCIFIASLGQQAKSIQQQLPAGHGFECFDTSRMPIVLQQIFQATDVLN